MIAISYQIAWPSTSAFLPSMTISFETSEVWHPTKLQELSSLQFVAWVLHRNFRALICEVVPTKFWPHWDAMIVVICDVKRFRLLSYNTFLGNPFVVGFGVWTGSALPIFGTKGCLWSHVGFQLDSSFPREMDYIVISDQHWKSIYLITIIDLEKTCPSNTNLMVLKLCQDCGKNKLRTFCIWKACRVSL